MKANKADKPAPPCQERNKGRPVFVVHTDNRSYAYWADDPYQNAICECYGVGRQRAIFLHLAKMGYTVW